MLPGQNAGETMPLGLLSVQRTSMGAKGGSTKPGPKLISKISLFPFPWKNLFAATS